MVLRNYYINIKTPECLGVYITSAFKKNQFLNPVYTIGEFFCDSCVSEKLPVYHFPADRHPSIRDASSCFIHVLLCMFLPACPTEKQLMTP